MKLGWKKGAVTGLVSAGLAYVFTLNSGFNNSSFTLLLYLYVLTGIAAGLEFEDIGSGFLDRFMIVAKEEEVKLKKVFSDEEYVVKGTLEKS